MGEDDLSILKTLYEKIDELDWREYADLDDATLELLADLDTPSFSEANLSFQTLGEFRELRCPVCRLDTVLASTLYTLPGDGMQVIVAGRVHRMRAFAVHRHGPALNTDAMKGA